MITEGEWKIPQKSFIMSLSNIYKVTREIKFHYMRNNYRDRYQLLAQADFLMLYCLIGEILYNCFYMSAKTRIFNQAKPLCEINLNVNCEM